MALPISYKRFTLGGYLKETDGLQSNINPGSTKGLSYRQSEEKTKQKNAEVSTNKKTNSAFQLEP